MENIQKLSGEQKLVVVSTSVLPDIFIKVLEAKRRLACREVKNLAQVCREIGISRSAYYKYRDSVFSYDEKLKNRIISLYFLLRDEPGVLSSVLSKLYELKTNILTVNQNIPVDSVAAVTVSIRFDSDISPDTSSFKESFSSINGVIDVRMISGE